MFFCNINKRIYKLPPCVPIRKWVILVKDHGSVLEYMGYNTASTSRVKYRSVLKAKLEVYETKESSTKYDIEMIPADVPKGEKN